MQTLAVLNTAVRNEHRAVKVDVHQCSCLHHAAHRLIQITVQYSSHHIN